MNLIDFRSGRAAPEARDSINGCITKQMGMSAQLKKHSDLMCMVVDEIIQAKQAESIIKNGQAEILVIARPILEDHCWLKNAARNLGVTMAKVFSPFN